MYWSRRKEASKRRTEGGLDWGRRKVLESGGSAGFARIFFTASEGKEGKEENGSLEAPVNSEHEATVDWKQEAKVRRMKAESN